MALKINKKSKFILSLSLISFLFVGCSIKNQDFPKNKNYIKAIKNYHKLSKEKYIEEIKIPSYINKYKNINHYFPKENKRISFKIKKSFYLGELTSIDNIPVYVDPLIGNKKIEVKNYNGTIKDFLDMISSMTNSYWTYEKGIIKFKKTTEIVYTFPALSLGKIYEVYNIDSSDNDKIDMDLENSIFKELSSVIKDLSDAYNIKANIVYSKETKNNFSKIESNLNKNLGQYKNNNKVVFSKTKVKNGKNDIENNSDYNLKHSSKLTSQVNNVVNELLSNVKTNKKLKEVLKDKISSNLPDSSLIDKKSQYSNDEIKREIFNNSFNKNINEEKNKEKTNTIQINNNKEKSILKISSFKIEETLNTPKERIVLSPNSGTVIAFVNPEEEKKLDLILNSIMKKRFSSMIRLRTVALLTTSSKVKNFQNKLYAALSDNADTAGGYGKGVEFGTGNSNIYNGKSLTGFSLVLGKGLNSLSLNNFNMLVDYFVSDGSGSILLNPNLVLLPNILGRIKDTTNIPFIQPEQLTNTQDNTLTYNVNYVKEGLNMAYIASVFNDNIIIAQKFSVSQYLGDKLIQAGNLGAYSLPMYAPKTIQTTYRIRPGDIMVLAGLEQNKNNFEKSTHFKIPDSLKHTKDKLEFVLISQPQLIKFVVDKNIKEYTPYHDINLEQIKRNKNEIKKNFKNMNKKIKIDDCENDKLDQKIKSFIKNN
jgi:hypothetical protein